MEEELQNRLDPQYCSRAITTLDIRVLASTQSLVQRHAKGQGTTSQDQYDALDIGDLRCADNVSG